MEKPPGLIEHPDSPEYEAANIARIASGRSHLPRTWYEQMKEKGATPEQIADRANFRRASWITTGAVAAAITIIAAQDSIEKMSIIQVTTLTLSLRILKRLMKKTINIPPKQRKATVNNGQPAGFSLAKPSVLIELYQETYGTGNNAMANSRTVKNSKTIIGTNAT